MPKSKKTTPATTPDTTTTPENTTATTPAPETLDQQAKDLYDLIEGNELLAATNYRNLGELLRQIQEQHKWKYPKLLEHAVKTLSMNKTKFTRASRIFKHCPTVEDCKDKTIYEALGYAPCEDEPKAKKPGPVTPLPVNHRITRTEQKAAEGFVKRVGDPLRALSVLVRYQTGETPEEDHKKQEKETKAKAKQMLKDGEPLDALRKVVGNGDNESQKKAVEVLTALKDGAGVVIGKDDDKTHEYIAEVLDGMKKGETESQEEPGKNETETQSPLVKVATKTKRQNRQQAAVQVARKAANDVGSEVKAVIAKHPK